MMVPMRLLFATPLALCLACGGGDASPDAGGDASPPVDAAPDTSAPDADASPDTSLPDAMPLSCGTAGRELPVGLDVIEYASDAETTHLGEQMFSIDVGGVPRMLATEDLYEAARFDVEEPVRVYGFSVQLGDIPDDWAPEEEIEVGLYRDFGHNGFDFWRADPLWTGTRCKRDAEGRAWVDYVFDEPIVMAQPGLLYVAHHRLGAESAAFLFAMDGADSCEGFDACHSSLTMPRVDSGSFYTGTSFPFQFDYKVRLHVEATESLTPEERIFQERPGPVGSRVAFGDFDEDGWDDYVTNGPALHRNVGDGTFEDVTASSGIAAMGLGGNGVFGDYDNDGCPDLYIFAESNTVPNALLRNECDGTFTDVTLAAGVVDTQDYNDCGAPENIRNPSPAAAWLDIDSDGYLDLYVANFICWTPGTFYTDTVFHNRADGTFEEWTGTHGFSTSRTPSRGAAPVDVDGDGDVDLAVNNYRLVGNLFYRNNGDSTVSSEAEAAGLAGTATVIGGGRYFGHTIGVAWGDIDNDGDFDSIQANLAHPRFYHFSDRTQVLLNDGAGRFRDITGDWALPESAAGLRYQETHSSPVLADFDHDGDLDLVITCIYEGRPTDFYWGNGDGTFELDVYQAGIPTENGWGVAVADWDHDGDLDLAASRLLENTADTGASHWLQVRAVGNVDSNHMAIGATVSVTAAGVTRIRHVQGGSGQGCQDSPYLHFGLDGATSVESIVVAYPGGASVTYAGPFDADQRVWVMEDGATHLGWSPPAD